MGEKGVVDLFKEGVNIENFVSIEVDGKQIGTSISGSRERPRDTYKVLIQIAPYEAGYDIAEIRCLFNGKKVYIELLKREEEKK